MFDRLVLLLVVVMLAGVAMTSLGVFIRCGARIPRRAGAYPPASMTPVRRVLDWLQIGVLAQAIGVVLAIAVALRLLGV